MEMMIIYFFVLITGACIGSFLNVVALRAISKESIVLPPSKCPLCGERIKWYDNIPVFSYFFTFKGKCRNCNGKVSIQYPIVEALTALFFLFVFIKFGLSVISLLVLILISLSIVITITDIKKNEVYDVHTWILIIFAIVTGLYLKGINNYTFVAVGLLSGVFFMEFIARLSYYLVRKKDNHNETVENNEVKEENQNESNTQTQETQEDSENGPVSKSEDEDVDINEYVEKNKRAFGEGDTYIAAAVGALLGWKYLLVALAFSIVLQSVCILPQFLLNLYKQHNLRLLISLSSFTVLAVIYWVLSNLISLNLYIIFAIVIALIFFAIDSITLLKRTTNEQGFKAIPFGPALLLSMFLILFYGINIVSFLNKHIFMIFG